MKIKFDRELVKLITCNSKYQLSNFKGFELYVPTLPSKTKDPEGYEEAQIFLHTFFKWLVNGEFEGSTNDIGVSTTDLSCVEKNAFYSLMKYSGIGELYGYTRSYTDTRGRYHSTYRIHDLTNYMNWKGFNEKINMNILSEYIRCFDDLLMDDGYAETVHLNKNELIKIGYSSEQIDKYINALLRMDVSPVNKKYLKSINDNISRRMIGRFDRYLKSELLFNAFDELRLYLINGEEFKVLTLEELGISEEIKESVKIFELYNRGYEEAGDLRNILPSFKRTFIASLHNLNERYRYFLNNEFFVVNSITAELSEDLKKYVENFKSSTKMLVFDSELAMKYIKILRYFSISQFQTNYVSRFNRNPSNFNRSERIFDDFYYLHREIFRKELNERLENNEHGEENARRIVEEFKIECAKKFIDHYQKKLENVN